MEREPLQSPEEMSKQDIDILGNKNEEAQRRLMEEFGNMSDDELKIAYQDAWSHNPKGEELRWDEQRGVSGAEIQQATLYEMTKRGLSEKK